METAGYSLTPLVRKLGIKKGFHLRVINQPGHYFSLLTGMPENVVVLNEKKSNKNLIHYFALSANNLKKDLPALKNELVADGMIWVSWPIKSSKLPTDVTENLVRELALSNGLVDIKVCTVDETWSGLKLVIPVKHRHIVLAGKKSTCFGG